MFSQQRYCPTYNTTGTLVKCPVLLQPVACHATPVSDQRNQDPAATSSASTTSGTNPNVDAQAVNAHVAQILPSVPNTLAKLYQNLLLVLTITESDKAKVAMASHMLSHGAPSYAAELVIEVIYSHVNPDKFNGLQQLLVKNVGNGRALVCRVAHKYSVDLARSFPRLSFWGYYTIYHSRERNGGELVLMCNTCRRFGLQDVHPFAVYWNAVYRNAVFMILLYRSRCIFALSLVRRIS